MSDEKFYSLIADELEHGKTDRMLWTRALGKSDGDADRTKAYYINARLAALKLTDTAVPPGLQLDNQKAPGSKMAADSRLLLLRGELAEALQDKRTSSFYSVLSITPEATDAAVAAAIARYESKVDSGTAPSTPEFKYAKDTLGNAKARETYDRRLFGRMVAETSQVSRNPGGSQDHNVASNSVLVSLWETRKTSVIVGTLSLFVVTYMVLGFYKEREASATRKKALEVQILQTNRAAEVAATRADTERALVDGSVRNDEKLISTQGQVANRIVGVQESAESRQSRELEYRANAGTEILRQQEERLKVANDQLKWERAQSEKATAAQQGRDRVAADKRQIFQLMMSQGRTGEARAYAQTYGEIAQVDAQERNQGRR